MKIRSGNVHLLHPTRQRLSEKCGVGKVRNWSFLGNKPFHLGKEIKLGENYFILNKLTAFLGENYRAFWGQNCFFWNFSTRFSGVFESFVILLLVRGWWSTVWPTVSGGLRNLSTSGIWSERFVFSLGSSRERLLPPIPRAISGLGTIATSSFTSVSRSVSSPRLKIEVSANFLIFCLKFTSLRDLADVFTFLIVPGRWWLVSLRECCSLNLCKIKAGSLVARLRDDHFTCKMGCASQQPVHWNCARNSRNARSLKFDVLFFTFPMHGFNIFH